MVTKDVSNRLFNLTFVCTILIVLLHLPISYVERGVLYSLVLFLKKHVVCVGVPFFFAISGYLLAEQSHRDGWYFIALRKRFFSLVVPYFAICTLFILMLLFHNFVLHSGNWPDGGPGFDWYTISRIYGLSINMHPVCGPLWYVRCLVMFIVLSPILVCLIRRGRIVAYMMVAVMLGGVIYIESLPCFADMWHFFYSFFSLRGTVFFAIGMVCAYHPITVRKAHGVVLALLMIILAEAFALSSIFVWAGLMGFLFWTMPKCVLPRWMISSCFAIYVFHLICFDTVSVFVNRNLHVRRLFATDVGIAIPLLLTLGFIFMLTYSIRRWFPRVNVLLGGRC